MTGSGPVNGLAFSPDGRLIATATSGRSGGDSVTTSPTGTVALWDVATGKRRTTLLDPRENRHVWGVAFSPDGKTVAASMTTNGWYFQHWEPAEFRLWDVQTGQQKLALKSSGNLSCSALAFSPDGQTFATLGAMIELWDTRTGAHRLINAERFQYTHTRLPFSRDGAFLFGQPGPGHHPISVWKVADGAEDPAPSDGLLAGLPSDMAHPAGLEGSAVSLLHPRDGHVLCTMLPVPEPARAAAAARPLELGAKAVGDSAAGDWFISTPEGYFDCSANAALYISWNLNGVLYPADRYLSRFRRPDLVLEALKGGRINAPVLSADDIPPAAYFVMAGRTAATVTDPMTVIVEARGHRGLKGVLLFVNDRPLPTAQAQEVKIVALPSGQGSQVHPFVSRFTFSVRLPAGSPDVRLRAVAYDQEGLRSAPAEVSYSHPGTAPVAGNLYVLCVGVSKYRNANGTSFKNLVYPSVDARAIAGRVQQEGLPLYQKVEVKSLYDEDATLGHIKEGLQWLQQKVRPGWVDTAVIFLSGHGLSDAGHYYFVTHDLDPGNISETGLSGQELQEELGGKLQAKAVFLFVDTCHSGAISGARAEDLKFEVEQSGVDMIASSGATQYSFESPVWGHGAFTLAMLHVLQKKELAKNGVLYFNMLSYALPDEVALLMQQAGLPPGEQAPMVPLDGRSLLVPVAQVR